MPVDASCKNCHVPMNLCHCSKSSCSACSLPAGNVCECLSSKEKAVRSGKEKALQEVCEKALQEMTKRESDATKHLTALQRECADVKKRLADERAKTQAEREAKGAQDKAHRATIEGLEKRIESAEPSRAIQERMAELEKATHLAVNMEATSEGKRKASEKQLAAAREEVTELRERTRRAEETAAAANEERQQRAAEYVESTETERQLTSALAAARTEVDDLRAEMRKHASMRTALEESESIRDDLKAEVTRLGKQLAKEKEHTLAYEGAVAENRSLRERLDDAIAKAKHEAEVAATERGKAAALAAERVQLQASLTHAERVKELFASVTSRTNQVQDAANDVIASVAARRRAHAEQELHQAENGGAVTAAGGMMPPGARAVASAGGEGRGGLVGDGRRTPSSGGRSDGAPIQPREGWTLGGGTRGPLQAKQQLAMSTSGQANIKQPQPPMSARNAGAKGLAPGRPGTRSVLTPRG